MKKILVSLVSLASLFVVPTQASAVFNVGQGGTGQTSFATGTLIYGNGTSALSSVGSGTSGYVLQYNGSAPVWVATSTLGIATVPSGSNSEIQFNNSGIFGSDSHLTYSVGTQTLGVSNLLGSPTAFLNISAASGGGSGYGPYDGQDVEIHAGSTTPGAGSGNGGRAFIFGGNALGTTTGFGGDAVLFAGKGYDDLHNGAAALLSGSQRNQVFVDDNYGVGLNSFGRVVQFSTAQVTTSDKVFSFPNHSGIFGVLEANQTWSGNNTFSKGASGTSTVNFGQMGSTTSHVCFNTKNTDGNDISFYFVGTAMVVENNTCN